MFTRQARQQADVPHCPDRLIADRDRRLRTSGQESRRRDIATGTTRRDAIGNDCLIRRDVVRGYMLHGDLLLASAPVRNGRTVLPFTEALRSRNTDIGEAGQICCTRKVSHGRFRYRNSDVGLSGMASVRRAVEPLKLRQS